MKATLSLEYIGEAQDARLSFFSMYCDNAIPGISKHLIGIKNPRKPWVAELTGFCDKFKFARSFVKPNWQRKNQNGNGNRGVYLWFVVESGRVYEVKSYASWRSVDRYFCTVSEQGEVLRISIEDVEKCLKNRLG